MEMLLLLLLKVFGDLLELQQELEMLKLDQSLIIILLWTQ
jgi:hypothetical protein